MRLSRDDKELIAKALNHLKNFHREITGSNDLVEYNKIQADSIIELAIRLKLDGDYFDYEGREEVAEAVR